jgi:hypothetical protein
MRCRSRQDVRAVKVGNWPRIYETGEVAGQASKLGRGRMNALD